MVPWGTLHIQALASVVLRNYRNKCSESLRAMRRCQSARYLGIAVVGALPGTQILRRIYSSNYEALH